MNEPKQIPENELAIYFCEEACNDIACSAVDSDICRYRNAALKIAKSYGWIKPDPTPEEEFDDWIVSQFGETGWSKVVEVMREAALDMAEKIRKEYEDGK